MFCCTDLFNQPLNDWNVSNVIDINGMFRNSKKFNQPLNNWDISNVKDMENIFDNSCFDIKTNAKWFNK